MSALRWPELTPGILVRRYKRFLADICLENGETITAHCPNPGSMKECCQPGATVYVSSSDNPRRKLKHTWELIETSTSLVVVNSLIPNRLVKESLRQGTIKELRGYQKLKPEAKAGPGSRLDFLLSDPEKSDCYVEVKGCSMARDGVAAFPDAVTARGLKHLVELQKLIEQGARCAMFFLIQRMDARIFQPAFDIDPKYAQELRKAAEKGVEIIAYDVNINLSEISLNKRIPCQLAPRGRS